ncbi:BON domain-containing protein [Diaphorobacter sp.]|uniref:BON domain-containing protein n=1 Tax=Diaphorobacter sp. TaxID=1934310 RepID=UPI0028A6F549|nr:BON domain-containing protein [Diaphorobacter sp.]
MQYTQLSDAENRSVRTRGTAIALAVLLTAGLVACDKQPADQTAGQKLDTAIAKTEAAADDAKAKTEAAADNAKAKMEVAADDAKQKMDAAAQDVSQAAQNAASNAAVALDNTAITTKVKAAFAADPNLSAVLISVDTKDGVVTLSGPVKTADDSKHAQNLTQAVEGVKSVVNELKVTAG